MAETNLIEYHSESALFAEVALLILSKGSILLYASSKSFLTEVAIPSIVCRLSIVAHIDAFVLNCLIHFYAFECFEFTAYYTTPKVSSI